MKICKCCGVELSYDNFTKSKKSKDGYEGKCKQCRLKSRLKHLCKCVTCGNEWLAQTSTAKYCSVKCKPQNQKKRFSVNCSICGKEKEVTKFILERNKDFYCSDECKNKGYSLKYSGENSARYNKVELNCRVCGMTFKRNLYEANKYAHHYCSVECKAIDYGRRFVGENHPSFGKKRPDVTGELNPNWNPNRTHEKRKAERKLGINGEWTRDVLLSDNYTCQCCNRVGGNLVAHHIDGFNWCVEKRTDIKNGATLCEKCHKLFHSIYKYGNNTKQQYEEFLKVHGNTERIL